MRDERAFVARTAERPMVEPVRAFAGPRVAVVGRVVVRAVTVVPAERVVAAVRGATVVVVVRVATFFVALRGSAAPGAVVVRAFVAPERTVAPDDFWDCVIVFAPRIGVDVETFVAVVRDAARAISS